MAASVRVVHVDTRPGENPLPVTPEKSVEGELLHTHVSSITDELGGYLTAEVLEEVVVGASPAEEILKVVARNEPSLVVMGTHGDGALIRTLIGSVSSSVARQVEAPVLLVPPNLWKARESDVIDVELASPNALGL
jgi:nucleotide-binding universal stress UspA family protein